MYHLRALKFLSLTCASIVTIMGFAFLLSWHLGLDSILQLPPATWPYPYTSSLILFFIGLSMLSVFEIKRLPLINIFGAIVFLLSLDRLIEIWLNINPDLNDTIISYLPPNPNKSNPLTVQGSITYGIMGVVLLCWPWKKHSTMRVNFVLFVLFVIGFLSLVGLLSSVIPIKSAFGWSDRPVIHFYGSVALLFASIGLILARFYFEILAGINFIRWLPIAVTLTSLVFTIIIVLGMKEERDTIIKDLVDSKVGNLQSQIETAFTSETLPLIRLVRRTEYEQKAPNKEWEIDADSLINDLSELKSIAWTNSKLVTLNLVPDDLKTEYLSRPLFELTPQIREKLLEAEKNTEPFAVLSSNSERFMLCYPINRDNKLQGFLVFTIDPQEFFKKNLREQIKNDFAVEITSDHHVVYRLNELNAINIAQWKDVRPISLYNLKLNLALSPTSDLVASRLGNQVLYLALISGFIISSVLGLLIYLWQLAQQRIISIEESQKQIKKIKDDLLYTLETAEIGTWHWNIASNQVACNEVTYRIFGLRINTPATYDTIINLIHPEDRESIEASVKSSLETGAQIAQTYRTLLPDGSIHYVMSRGRTHVDESGKTVDMTGICWDITGIKRTQLFLETLDRITKALSESMTTAEAAIKVRHILYRVFGWEVMIVWIKNQKTESLDCLELSIFHELNIPEFESFTQANPLSKNETVPGIILSTHRPIWYADYTKSVISKRAKAAGASGLKGFFAFPIFEGTTVIGIVELFKTTLFNEEVDESLLNLTTSIGVYFGQFIQRRANEEAQAQLASIVTYASGAIYICDLNGIIRTWNAGAERIFGWSEKEVIGQHVTMLYPPDHRDAYALIQVKMRAGESIEKFEIQRMKKDGSIIWVENSYSPIRNDSGSVISTCIITHEITEQKLTTLELQKSEEKFRAFVETTEEWVWEIDSNFRLRYTNPTVYKVLGFTPEEVMGKELFTIIPERYRDKIRAEIVDFIKSKRGWTARLYKARHANGTIRYFESNAVPILDDNDNVIGFRGADRDITERRLIEKSKSEFISTVSHELRTPLTSIHGALGLISNMKDLPPKVKELTAVAYRNSERLSHIINDILDLEKSKLGKLELRTKPIYLAQVILESIISMRPMAEKHRITLVQEEMLTDLMVFADPERLIQVITNFLSNAIKFSHPLGKVYISMEKRDKDVRVSVRDEGIGISNDFQPKVFERFTQANSSDSRLTGGTGLGLNICKTIIEQIGGRIGFTSIPGRGSTFYFDLLILPRD